MFDQSCNNCGESLFEGELFCPSCGRASASTVAVVTPPGATPAPGAARRTQVGEVPVPCENCGRELAEIERYCPGCGSARPGLATELKRPRRAGADGAWKQLAKRLAEVTKGRYEIVREIGRGGMAAVFLAHETALDRKVAIKVMRPSFLLDDAMVDRFLREARTMASFQHRNIVTVHAVEAVDDLHFFVMQYIAGQSLAQVLREFGPLPIAAIQSVVHQAAAGLTHAHKVGVIHRDVKPANIMIDGQGNALVTDFGIAKVTDVTTSATVGPMGTPLYMSPEQCSGVDTLTPASDQYSLGTVAFELLTGKPPFERESAVALALAISKDEPPSVRSLRPDCPPEIDAAVRRMLAKRPEQRWPSLIDAVAAVGGEALPDDDPVRGYLAALALRETSPVDSRSLTPRRSRTGPSKLRYGDVTSRIATRRIWAGVGILVVAAVATVFAVTRALRPAAEPAPADTVVVQTPPAAPAPPDSGPTREPSAPDPTAEISRRLAAASVAIRGGDLTAAERELGQVLALDAGNSDARSMMATIRRARQAAPPAAPPDPTPVRVDTVQRVDTVLAAVPPPAPPPPSADPARAAPVSRAPAIRAVLGQYVEAINARSLSGIRAVYPALPSDRESAWRDIFAPDVKDVRATLSIGGITERGDVADASFTISLSFRPDRGQPLSYTIVSDATVQFSGGGWRIVSMKERGA